MKAWAQTLEPLSQQSWSTEEGLPDASVHALSQARDGYLWFGTEAGAVRFDGYNFVIFRHENVPAFASDDVSAIAQDRDGALWFGTADGLVRRNGEAFQHYGEANGLPSAHVLSMAADRLGDLVVLTTKGVAVGGGKGFHVLGTLPGQVLTLTPAADGDVLLTTTGGELFRMHAGRLLQEGRSPTGQSGPIIAVEPFGPGSLLSFGVRFVDLRGPHLHRLLQAGHELPAARVQSILPDRAGRVWIGTSRGLLVLNSPAATPEPVASFHNESILSLLQDEEGNLWVGTEGSGLHILRPRKVRAIEGTLGDAVTTVAVTSEGVPWIGTRNRGLRRLGQGSSEEPVTPAALTSSVILSLTAGLHGDVWAGTPDGLNHVVGNDVHKITAAEGLPDDFLRSLQVDRRGVLWAGTRRGLARIAQDGSIRTVTTAEGLGSDSVGALLLPPDAGPNSGRDELWVGTSAGLSYLQGQELASFALQKVAGASIVTALAEVHEGALLVAFHGLGLFAFKGGHFFPIASPLLPREITAMVVDRLDFLWLRSAKGLFRARIADLQRCASAAGACGFPVSTFSSGDGLPTEAGAAEGSPELALGPDGRIWIATSKGLAVADPAHLPMNRVPPPIVVQSFTVDDAAVDTAHGEARISAGHNRYTFTFAGLSFTMPSRVRYRTFLQGFDRDWVNNGTGRVASYTSLPPRHYRFQVQAQNNDGIWSRDIATVDFVVKPPFYQRWWFYLSLAGTLALAIFGGIRLRERAVQRRFALVLEERNRLAREIHDTLAQDFVSMSLQLEIAATLLKQHQVEKAIAQMGTMRQAIKEGLQAARQSIWDLRASAGEDSLPAKLTALASRYAISGKPPRLSIGGAFRALSRPVESEVLRIAQESLTNVERHAHATEASVELQYGDQELLLTVKDNGRGFGVKEAANLQGHYGMRGMRERAASLGAELRVSSSPEQGTHIVLRVPISESEARPA